MKPSLKTLFLNADRRLRNGWWILIFIAFVAVTSFAYKPLSHGLKNLGVPKLWLEPVPFTLALLATWACTRLRKEPLSSAGFRLDWRWFNWHAAGVRWSDLHRRRRAFRTGPGAKF